MSDKQISFIRTIISLSGVFIVLGLIFQALSAHLAERYFGNPLHREYLKLASNALIIQSMGGALISFCPLTPLCRTNESKKWLLSSSLILIGTFLFSGSLTLIAFKMISPNFITPLGAILEMLGWIIPAFICISGVLRKNSL